MNHTYSQSNVSPQFFHNQGLYSDNSMNWVLIIVYIKNCWKDKNSENSARTIHVLYQFTFFVSNYKNSPKERAEMPTSGDLKSGDFLFFHTPPPGN